MAYIQHTAAYWVSSNPILNKGDIGVENDTGVQKVGDGITAWNSLAYFDTPYEYTTLSGTDTYTASLEMLNVLGYFTGQRIRAKFTNANTGAATINVNGLGAKAIKKNVSSALVSGDILAGAIHHLIYDGTNFQIENGVGTAGVVPTLSQVLTNGNDANAQSILDFQAIHNTVGTRDTWVYVDAPLAKQVYLYGSNSAPINGGDYFSILGNTTTVDDPLVSLSVYSGATISQTTLLVKKAQITITGTHATFAGAVYAADYSANYTSRSLIDKGYAAATFAALTAGLVPLSIGGTNKNMTAINGGVVWTDADSMEVTAAGSSGQILRSAGAAAPTWSTATFPSTATGTGTILRADGTNWVATTATYPTTTTANQILYSTAANTIGGSTTLLTDGTYLLVGATAQVASEVGFFRKDQNGLSLLSCMNATSSTTAYSAVVASSSATYTNYLGLYSYSALFTTSGISTGNTGVLFCNMGNGLNIGNFNATQLSFWTNNTKRVEVSAVGNVSIGGVATRATTVGTNTMQIFNGTAPVGTLSNGCSFYSTAGEMRVMDAAGNATLLSPHEKGTNYWVYDSVDTTTGKRLKIDMEQFMKWLNKKFKTDFVHEYMSQ